MAAARPSRDGMILLWGGLPNPRLEVEGSRRSGAVGEVPRAMGRSQLCLPLPASAGPPLFAPLALINLLPDLRDCLCYVCLCTCTQVCVKCAGMHMHACMYVQLCLCGACVCVICMASRYMLMYEYLLHICVCSVCLGVHGVCVCACACVFPSGVT